MRYKRVNNKLLAIILMLVAGLTLVYAQSQLFYLEGQGVLGYRSDTDDIIYYSHHQHEVMQKPSVGFDWLKRFSTDNKDVAVAAVQFRLAWDETKKSNLEPQLYNAWLKYKASVGDISAGHLKPASGLSYNLDNHALLIPDMTMYVFTFDRDWGLLYTKDTHWGNLSASLTNGSGMRFYRKDGNYLAAIRTSYGILNEHNYSIGVTAQKGEVFEAMGYQIGHNKIIHDMLLGGFDASIRYNNLESMIDVYAGEFYQKDAWSVLWRNGINLFSEDKLKLEVQSIWREFVGTKHSSYDFGLSWRLHPDWTLRAMYDYHLKGGFTSGKDTQMVVAQLYYYKRLF